MEEEKKQSVEEQLTEKTEKVIKDLLEEGIKTENIDFLGKVVDIHKDIANEEYWKVKKEDIMRYRAYEGYGEYGEYGDGESYGRRSRDSRGRYTEGSYGRRGVKGTGRGRYRGDEAMDEMSYHYGNYSENREQYGRGNYGAKENTIKSLEYMMESVVDFIEMLEQDATSQEEINIIKKYTKKISEM